MRRSCNFAGNLRVFCKQCVTAVAAAMVITAQKRHENLSTGEIDFTFQPGPGVGK
jgi:hypothetical protein